MELWRKAIYHSWRHKNLQNTELYIHIEETLFNEQNSEYHVKLAETVKEACELLEVGFEYVTDMEGKKLFRKRKWCHENISYKWQKIVINAF